MPRQLGPVGQTVLWWLPVVLIVYGGAFVLRQVSPSNSDTLGPILLVVAVAAGFLTSRLLSRLEASVVESLRFPAVDPSKILILRAAGDEAAAALGALHILSWVSGRLWLSTSRMLGRTVDTVDRWRATLTSRRLSTALVVGLLVLVFLVGVARWSSTEGTIWQPVVVSVGASLLLIVAILARGGLAAEFLGRFIFAAIAAPFLVLIAILGVGVGPELLAAGLLFQVTAEAAPPGRWVVWQVAATADEAEEPSSSALMHGATYQNAKALAIMGTWLATTLRVQEADTGARTRAPAR